MPATMPVVRLLSTRARTIRSSFSMAASFGAVATGRASTGAGCSPRHDGGEEQRQEPECTQTGQVISRRVTRFVPAAASASV
jgi:hypothetical protein